MSPAVKLSSARALASIALNAVLARGRALDHALDEASASKTIEPRERAYAQALCFAALREGWTFRQVLNSLVPKKPDALVQAVLMIGMADVAVLQTPSFAAVSALVDTARALKLNYASGLINAVMRRFAREQAALINAAKSQNQQAQHNLPEWLLKRLQQAYGPSVLSRCISGMHKPAPMWLRLQDASADAEPYAKQLRDLALDANARAFAPLPQALVCSSMPVSALPGFADGALSVQDGAAQLAAHLLVPQAEERILDACAAPGGKTAHLLALAPTANVLAVDRDAVRLRRVQENLTRLHCRAELLAADAAQLGAEHGVFDAILLDAPCSATGVIRRHPDIAWLRRETDIAQSVQQQAALLDALWPRLKSGGRLVYATCSVLPEENSGQIQAFLARQADAKLVDWPVALGWFGAAQLPFSGDAVGRQNLPGESEMDGFYYALLVKQ